MHVKFTQLNKTHRLVLTSLSRSPPYISWSAVFLLGLYTCVWIESFSRHGLSYAAYDSSSKPPPESRPWRGKTTSTANSVIKKTIYKERRGYFKTKINLKNQYAKTTQRGPFETNALMKATKNTNTYVAELTMKKRRWIS